MLVAEMSWVVFALIFIAGLIVGGLLFRVFSPKNLQANKVKHQLTAKELELSQVKEDVNQHFLRTAEGLAALSKQLNELQDQLTTDAQTLAIETEVTEKLRLVDKVKASKTKTAATKKEANQELNPEDYMPPRDYSATSKGGTLAENFAHPNFEQPKDYAANSEGGTLAEDFGFNKADKPAKKKKKKKKQQTKDKNAPVKQD